MIGGLPQPTAVAIVDHLILILALIAGSIVLTGILAVALWFFARKVRRPWDRVLRISGATLGACVAVAAVLFCVLVVRL